MSKGFKSPEKYRVPEEVSQQVRKLITDFMKKEQISLKELAEKLEEKYGRSGSSSNLLNKMHRASFSLAEFIQILEAYGYKISYKKSDRTTSGTIYS